VWSVELDAGLEAAHQCFYNFINTSFNKVIVVRSKPAFIFKLYVADPAALDPLCNNLFLAGGFR
jgi:hypothetical protein